MYRKVPGIISAVLVLLVAMTGCIKNDVPYPQIPQYILTLAAEGEEAPANIDDQELTVTLFLSEQTNPKTVRFSEFTYSEGAECSENLLCGTYDLTRPLTVTLSKYQRYQWVISAQQTITREVSIQGQIGATVIDEVGRRVIIKVPETEDLSQLNLTALKLGPADITQYSPDIQLGVNDFSHPVKLEVSYWDETELWTIYVQRTKLLVSTVSADAWSEVVWVVGNAPESAQNGVHYREANSETWVDVPKEWITFDGGTFTARIIHLRPLTQYVVRAVSDENIGNEITVTTQATADLVDGSFDEWWLNGKVWCPWAEGGVRYWDTGNTGAATLGQSNVQPSDYTPTGSGKSAKLETRFVGIGSIGKLAAGSIYTGSFKKVDGTNGILDFGREFNLRPTKLKGYYQYTTAPINYADADHKYLLERPDSCNIYIALTDWPAPYEIRTNPKSRQLFDKNAPEVIAFGELIVGDSFEGYKEFEIELQYRSTSRVPRYILITCAASKYGDFFTGGAGACLYVDQFSLHYDY